MNARLRVLAAAMGLVGLAMGFTGCATTPTASVLRADDPRLIGTWAGEGERAEYRLNFQSKRFSLERGEWVQSKGSYTAEAGLLRFRATGLNAEPEVGVYRLPDPDMLIIETVATGEVVWRRQGARAPGAFPELEDVGRTIEKAEVAVEDTAQEEWREPVAAGVGVEARRDGNDGESTGEAGEADATGEIGEAADGDAPLPGDLPPL